MTKPKPPADPQPGDVVPLARLLQHPGFCLDRVDHHVRRGEAALVRKGGKTAVRFA